MVSAPPPQVWIAAFGTRMMRLTARYADGWNAAWFGADPSRFRRGVERLWAELDGIGRPRSSVTVSAGLFVVPSGPDGRTSEKALSGDTGKIAAGLRAFEDAGARHVVLSLATAPFRLDDPAYIEKVARAFHRSDS